jgi:alpha,alpha-trehalase
LPDDVQPLDLKRWVEQNFYEPGFEVDKLLPVDWKANVTVLKQIKDERVNQLASSIHHRWRELVRFYNASKLNVGSVSSHLPLPKPFVVPGGRFNEFYYWDSYWILQGHQFEMHASPASRLQLISVDPFRIVEQVF